MKTIFEYIADILILIIGGVSFAAIGALIAALSPIISIFIIAKD